MLNKMEMELLARVIMATKCEPANRAGQTQEDIYEQFETLGEERILKAVNLNKRWYNIYKEVESTPLPKHEILELDSLDSIIGEIALNTPEEEKRSKPLYKPLKNQDRFRPYFAMLNKYNTEFHEIGVNFYNNDKKLLVTFIANSCEKFAVEFPLVNNKGFFTHNGNEYVYMYSPKNLEEYIEGKDKELKLVHPLEALTTEMLTAFFKGEQRVLINEETFNKRKRTSSFGIAWGFQRTVNNYLSNITDTEFTRDTPIVLMDKYVGEVGRECFVNNVFLNAPYKFLIKHKRIKGLDLLTGSTSIPGKRVRLAANYEIAKDEEGTVVARKVRDLGELGDYLCQDKMDLPFLNRTSGKRQNSATIKDSYDLIHQYKPIFGVKIVEKK